jgi:hypothetical protein
MKKQYLKSISEKKKIIKMNNLLILKIGSVSLKQNDLKNILTKIKSLNFVQLNLKNKKISFNFQNNDIKKKYIKNFLYGQNLIFFTEEKNQNIVLENLKQIQNICENFKDNIFFVNYLDSYYNFIIDASYFSIENNFNLLNTNTEQNINFFCQYQKTGLTDLIKILKNIK